MSADEPTEADPPTDEHWFTLPTGGLLYGDGTGGITVAGLAAWKDCPERTAAIHALSRWCSERVGGRPAAPTCGFRFCELPAGHEGDHRIDLLRSAAPTRDEMIDALNQSIVEQGYGDTDIDTGDLLDALAGITGEPPAAAPTREEIAETIREVMRGYSGRIFAGTLISDRVDYTRELTDAVVALLSLSAAEPPPVGTVAAAVVKATAGHVYAAGYGQAIADEVAAELNEEHDDG